MQRNIPHTWMHRHRHSSCKSNNLTLTHEGTEIIIPQVNVPGSYPSHKMHQNRHSSGKCIEILPLTHECTEIITPEVNAPESYPSHIDAPKSSFLKYMQRNPTPHTWMHRHRLSSGKFMGVLPLTHECTKIVTPQVNAPESCPSHKIAPKSSLLR